MSRFANKSDAELAQIERAAATALAIERSRQKLLPYIKFTMPDPDNYDDPNATVYTETPQARLLCEILQKVERSIRGELKGPHAMKRVAVSIGPQLGKSEIISRRFPAWFSGRNPRRHVILGSYNQDFANEFGDEVRDISRSKRHSMVFPKHGFRKGSESKSHLITTEGGRMAFVGVGGSGSGKPADLFVVDDPIKSDVEAQSEVYLDTLWRWFMKVAFARLHANSAVVVVHTRWTENDIIGRLCDPNHPDHDPVIAKKWQYFNLPAVVTDPELARALGLKLETQDDPEVVEQFGEKPMCSLWEARKPLTLLAEVRRLDPVGYEALYNGNPSPEEGDYFKKDWLIEYDEHELPRDLTVYGASDHALGKKAENDENVIGRFGVDTRDTIWILPDLFMGKFKENGTFDMVEELLRQMKGADLTVPRPLVWWAEDEHISKSIGPFLHKRMLEEKVYCTIDPLTSTVDLRSRARAIQGRMKMGKVRFPRWAPWWQKKARPQILRFDHATHDDFVSFLSLIGRGLMKETPAEAPQPENVIRVGSFAWVKAAADRDRRHEEARKAAGGW